MTGALRALTSLLLCATLVSCGDSRSRPFHEPPPLIRVIAFDSLIRTESVQTIMTPKIAFRAMVQPDSGHLLPVISPALGSLARMTAAGPVPHQGRLAVLQGVTGHGLVTLRAAAAGTWMPRRVDGQVVAAGDTIGTIRRRNLWLATGVVGELEHGAIHAGDPADVRVRTGPGQIRQGRVEAVHRPGSSYPYSAEVLVEFDYELDAGAMSGSMVSVVVHPSHARDSVLSVPRRAVVHFTEGAAVFAAADSGVYQLIWVRLGPEQDQSIVVTGELHARMSVAVSNLMPLAVAAAESLALARHQRDQHRKR